MEKSSLYTIGHGNKKLEEFAKTLCEHGIKYLIDVRSIPYSKLHPQFNQNELKYYLKEHQITYVFMGDNLGGRPKDTSCYDSEGKVKYDMVKSKSFFLDGIERIKTAYYKKIPVVLMCAESKPIDCHRSKLIGRALSDLEIPVNHIDENGKVKSQADVINELNKGNPDIPMFPGDKTDSYKSRKTYDEI